MKSIKTIPFATLLIGTTLLNSQAHADVTLLVDDNIKVTAINGNEITQSPFQPLKQTFTLQAGKHVITAKYDRLFVFNKDKHDYLRSANVSVATDLADNQTYRLTMPNQPKDYDTAKTYAKQPTLAIQQGDKILAEQKGIAGSDGGFLSGLTGAIGGLFGGSGSAKTANQTAIASLQAAPATQASTPASTPTKEADTLDQFMQIWLKATPSERAKIKQWISE